MILSRTEPCGRGKHSEGLGTKWLATVRSRFENCEVTLLVELAA